MFHENLSGCNIQTNGQTDMANLLVASVQLFISNAPNACTKLHTPISFILEYFKPWSCIWASNVCLNYRSRLLIRREFSWFLWCTVLRITQHSICCLQLFVYTYKSESRDRLCKRIPLYNFNRATISSLCRPSKVTLTYAIPSYIISATHITS
jgi:hypothetical protein